MFWWGESSSSGHPSSIGAMLSLNELLVEKKREINTLKGIAYKALRGIKNHRQSDEIYLLRYILSYRGDIAKASEALNKAKEWRLANKATVLKAMNLTGEIPDNYFPDHVVPYIPLIKACLTASSHKSTKNGQPVVVARLSCCSFSSMSSVVPPGVLCDYVVYSNEVEFWKCDELTRRTGNMHKTYRLVDLRYLSPKSIDRYFMKAFSAASQMSEFLHPQLVGKSLLVNAPSLVKFALDMMKRIGVSRRAMDKFWICKGSSASSSCMDDEIAMLVEEKDVPTFLGGKCNCPTGCVPGVSNNKFDENIVDTKAYLSNINSRLRSQLRTTDDPQRILAGNSIDDDQDCFRTSSEFSVASSTPSSGRSIIRGTSYGCVNSYRNAENELPCDIRTDDACMRLSIHNAVKAVDSDHEYAFFDFE